MQKIFNNIEFRKVLANSAREIISRFFLENQLFSIVCNLDGVKFNPELPPELAASFRDITIFALSGYTFASAEIEGDSIVFEAGFGKENFGSIVSVELDRIIQILIADEAIFINPTATLPKMETKKDSFGIFVNNPKNQKFFKEDDGNES